MRDLLKILGLFKKHQLWLWSGLAVCLVTILANIGLLSTSGWFITSSAIAGLAALEGAYHFNIHAPGAAVRGFALLRTISRYGERIVTHEATFRALAELRIWIFKKLRPLAPAGLEKFRSGDLLSRMTSDVDMLDKLYLRLLVPTTLAFLASCFFALMILRFLPALALPFCGIIFCSLILLPYWSQKTGGKASQETLTHLGDLRTAFIDHCQGLSDLISNQADQRSHQNLLATHSKLLEAQIKEHQVQTISQSGNLFLGSAVIFLFLLIGLPAILNQEIEAAFLALLILGVMAVTEATAPIAMAFQQVAQTKLAARRILEIAETHTLKDNLLPQTAYPTDVDQISFVQCSYQYPNRSSKALDNISVTLKKGERIALIGDSGSGKSTFMNLLMGFRAPTEGKILIGQQNSAQIAADDITLHQSYMEQRTHLFSAPLRDNLLIANPNASDAELITILQKVGLEKLLKTLPNGLSSWLGEHGSRLSGGQARRVALARLLLRPSTLYLFDEPTEGLDRATEADIMATILKETEGKTILLSTHRHHSLKQMDRILVFKEGQIIKDCTYEELCKGS